MEREARAKEGRAWSERGLVERLHARPVEGFIND
jgi:hypothetical protein